nr:MAG TPA: hypothetical protein [Caudoviricetes sp.]
MENILDSHVCKKRMGRGSDRKTTGRLLSSSNSSKNKKPLTTTPIDFHRK